MPCPLPSKSSGLPQNNPHGREPLHALTEGSLWPGRTRWKVRSSAARQGKAGREVNGELARLQAGLGKTGQDLSYSGMKNRKVFFPSPTSPALPRYFPPYRQL